MIPVSDLQAVEIAMAGVVAEDFYAQRLRNHWVAKIKNSDSDQLYQFLWDLAPKEARLCRHVIWSKFGVKLKEAIPNGGLDLGKLESLVMAMKDRQKDKVGTSDGAHYPDYKLVSQDSGVLELLRLTIVLAVINQLRRQMLGLVG